MNDKDPLGSRIKSQYEDRYRISLPRRTYTILRIDGRSFHTYTKNLPGIYSIPLMKRMNDTAIALCEEVAGTEFAFVQSDEISLLLTDFRNPETAAWFDGNLQKLVSVSASIATMAFNYSVLPSEGLTAMAQFDSRAFVIPDPVEVENYFIWRQKDAEKNSVNLLAQNYASHKQLHAKNRMEQHDIIYAAGDNWNEHPADFKRGRCIIYKDQDWQVDHETPIFTKDREYLKSKIPIHWSNDAEQHSQEVG